LLRGRNFPTARETARLNPRYAPANALFPFLPRYYLTTPFPHLHLSPSS
jgi:hypothetical protein